MTKIKFREWTGVLEFAKYNSNDRTAIELIDDIDGECIARVTVNIDAEPLNDNEIIIKDSSENEGIYKALLEAGVISKVKRFATSGYNEYPICDLLISTSNKLDEITLDNFPICEIDLVGNHIDTEIDLGSITLSLDDKEFVLDIVESERELSDDETHTTISLSFEIDKTIFPDCNYDLSQLDLLSTDVKGTIYFYTENMEILKEAKLYVQVKFTNKTIILELEE